MLSRLLVGVILAFTCGVPSLPAGPIKRSEAFRFLLCVQNEKPAKPHENPFSSSELGLQRSTTSAFQLNQIDFNRVAAPHEFRRINIPPSDVTFLQTSLLNTPCPDVPIPSGQSFGQNY